MGGKIAFNGKCLQLQINRIDSWLSFLPCFFLKDEYKYTHSDKTLI